jgi:uncharacterized protein (DUF2336 family)
VTSQRMILTAADVARLLQDPSEQNRAVTATKVASAYSQADLQPRERALAEEIFRAMVRDTAIRVRAALSEQLKAVPQVPRDVAVSLAKDVIEVAAPMLEFSSVLTDEDLVEIVSAATENHQIAIARRADLGDKVIDAIASRGGEDAVATLMANDKVEIGEAALGRAVDRFGSSEKVHTPIAHRSRLPIRIAERLVSLVSDSLRDHLVAHHDLPADIATDLVLSTRERVTLSLSADAAQPDVIQLVRQLHKNGRLTPTIVLRALCLGDVDFFEAALAAIANISVVNAHKLIHDHGALGLKALYEHCKLPAGLFPIARAAIDVARAMRHDGEPGDRQRFTERTIERLLTQFETGIDPANLDYLIGKLGRAA